MTPANSLILGLGLFFLGLRLIGENLRRLYGSSFRNVIKRTTHSPILGAGLGTLAGAVMQSATAVTFILVSLTDSGLIKARAAAPIIIWSNVGLTALAFVTTLNIHPLVAYVVGGAGIALGTVRIPLWQTVAGSLLGIGLILFGLQGMETGAAPLRDASWFQGALSFALASPGMTFLAGLLLAVVLQSNSGAAMLIITFASNGVLDLKSATLMLYGTNLGAIGLRLFLSAGLRGERVRLVRLEDTFCLLSGVMMTALFLVEQAGVPLVAATVSLLAVPIATKLAVVFLISNLLPALVLTPALDHVLRILAKLWPDVPATEDPSRPMYLRPQALDDPASAFDLLQKELARLLGMVHANTTGQSPEEDAPPRAFQDLSRAIEEFAAKLASRNTLNQADATRLHLLRAELSVIRHVEEAVRYFVQALERQGGQPTLSDALERLLALTTRAAESGRADLIDELLTESKAKGEEMSRLKEKVAPTSLATTALFEDFSVAVWTVRRLAKLLARLPG
jgi:phosphate:Na+ symporter